MKRVQFEYWHVTAILREDEVDNNAAEPRFEADFEHRESAVLAIEWAAQVRWEEVTARKDASELEFTRSEYLDTQTIRVAWWKKVPNGFQAQKDHFTMDLVEIDLELL